MKTRRLFGLLSVTALTAFGLSLASAPTLAQATFSVSLDTSSLSTAAYPGPYVLDFQFVDGDGLLGSPDANNTVSVSDFQGGTSFSAPTVTLMDGDPGAVPATGDAKISFTPGATLSFLTTLTTNEDQFDPDAFSFAILSDGTEIPTQDAFGSSNGSFVTITESSDAAAPAALDVETFDTAAGEFRPIVTPIIPSTVAPEPDGGVTLAMGLAAVVLAACPHRRQFKAASGLP